MMVPIQVIRWYRMQCYDGTDSCATVVPIRRYCQLASMDMEERYCLILSTILNAIGCRVEVEKMISTGRIDMVVETNNFIYVLELKLSNNGGIDAAAEQIKARQYAEPFKADKRKVIALAIELDDSGKGLVDWKEV